MRVKSHLQVPSIRPDMKLKELIDWNRELELELRAILSELVAELQELEEPTSGGVTIGEL